MIFYHVWHYFPILLLLFDSFFQSTFCISASFITPCKRNQSDFEICLIELIHNLKTRLPDGISEMKIQPLDPFYLPVVEFGSDSGLISVNNAIFENITVYGCSDFSFKNIS